MYDQYTWIFVCGIFVSLFVAYGIGANDVANAFASSVGAKALTMKQAIVVAAICEFLGSSLMGAGVTDTIRSGIADLNAYIYTPGLFMYGMLCALLSSGIWLIMATYWELPVSTTHSIVGAILGMSLVAAGPDSVLWSAKTIDFPYLAGLSSISLSWVFSPILSALIAMFLYLITRHLILRRKRSFDLALWSFPIYTFLTFFVIVFFIIKKGGQAFGWQKTPDWMAAVYGAWIAGIFTLISATLGIKFIRYKVSKDLEELEDVAASKETAQTVNVAEHEENIKDAGSASGSGSADLGPDSNKETHDAVLDPVAAVSSDPHKPMSTPAMLMDMRRSRVWTALTASANTDIHDVIETDEKIHEMHEHSERFDPKTELCFKYLQVFTACANSFAHGSNDVANAVGPFAAIYAVWECTCVNSKAPVPEWILVMGGVGIVLGLATYGYKIMRVLGVKMTRLTNSRGFCVELAAAITVILGSRYGLPLSTTHCMVGAVAGIGMLEGTKGFNAMLLVRFFFGWVATLVVAAATAAFFTAQGIFTPNYYTPDPTLAAIDEANAAAANAGAPAAGPAISFPVYAKL